MDINELFVLVAFLLFFLVLLRRQFKLDHFTYVMIGYTKTCLTVGVSQITSLLNLLL